MYPYVVNFVFVDIDKMIVSTIFSVLTTMSRKIKERNIISRYINLDIIYEIKGFWLYDIMIICKLSLCNRKPRFQ